MVRRLVDSRFDHNSFGHNKESSSNVSPMVSVPLLWSGHLRNATRGRIRILRGKMSSPWADSFSAISFFVPEVRRMMFTRIYKNLEPPLTQTTTELVLGEIASILAPNTSW